MQRASVRQEIRALGAFVAVGAMTYAVFVNGPSLIATQTGGMLASATVSISAAIPPNPYNTLAHDLAAKEASLTEREAALATRENSTSVSGVSGGVPWGALSFVLSLSLLILLVINFYLDMRRGVQMTGGPALSIDLRRR